MNYDEALEYIHSVSWKGSVPGLKRITALLELMGHPEKNCKYVHVTGTNGKGSTCAMVASVLRSNGYKTGLYTSPYLIRFNERMVVNGQTIADDLLSEITEYVKGFAETLTDKPTEFELTTAIAFEFFSREKCDFVVCEVGMGGEFDATNVIPAPEVAVICNVGLDHTQILGDTIEKIAATKAGIIKPGCDVVLYPSTASVEQVIRERCEAVGARLRVAELDKITLRADSIKGQVFMWRELEGIELYLAGEHQRKNAAVALTVIEALRERGFRITNHAIRRGIRTVKWHGRFELVRMDPPILVDGGHNPQCIEVLRNSIDKYIPSDKLVMVTGVLADKDYESMYAQIADKAKHFITVTPNSPRALDSHTLANYLKRFNLPVTACDSVEEGIKSAYELVQSYKNDDPQDKTYILVFGSLYMLADVYDAIERCVPMGFMERKFIW